MKWLLVLLVLIIAPACQIRQPETAPPGMPIDLENEAMDSQKALTQATMEHNGPAIPQ